MGLKESGLRGSLRNVSVGINAIPDSGLLHRHVASAGVTEDTTVTGWDDQESDLNLTGEATQTRDDGPNSKTVVEFDGDGSSPDKLDGSRDTSFAEPYEFYLVARLRTANDGVFKMLNNSSTSGRNGGLIQHSDGDWAVIGDDGAASQSGVTADTDYHIFNIEIQSGQAILRLDTEGNEIVNDSDYTSAALDGITLGARPSDDWPADCDIVDQLYYDPSDGDYSRSDVFDALQSEYGI